MAVGPIPFDVTMRPVKFVKAGGIFVAGGYTGLALGEGDAQILRAMAQENWAKVYASSEGDSAFIYGAAASSDQVFVVGGGVTVGDEHAPDRGTSQVILTSRDGQSWSETRRKLGGFCYVMGWNSTNGRFYAQAIADWFSPGQQSNTLEVLESLDGFSWHIVQSRGQAGFTRYASPFLEATGLPWLRDSKGSIIPNGGFAGWNGSRSVVISPLNLDCYWIAQAEGSEGGVEITTIDPETGAVKKRKVGLPMKYVQCVGHANGIWHAGGSNERDADGNVPAVIARSTDDGKTWGVVYTGGGFITTMAA